jgi:hypothetical protein
MAPLDRSLCRLPDIAQVWLHILVYMSIITPLYGISLFLP